LHFSSEVDRGLTNSKISYSYSRIDCSRPFIIILGITVGVTERLGVYRTNL
ncbi:unnamed protein product, partial [Ceratitis capitata]